MPDSYVSSMGSAFTETATADRDGDRKLAWLRGHSRRWRFLGSAGARLLKPEVPGMVGSEQIC